MREQARRARSVAARLENVNGARVDAEHANQCLLQVFRARL